MKFLAVIPARYASTRFPGKPLADLGGKPMVQHVYEKVSAFFPNTWVATDDGRIEAAVRGFGGRVVMTSPAHRSGTDRCCEALDAIEAQTGERYNAVVNIQGDEPFVACEQLERIVSCFDDPATDIATLVKPFAPGEDIFNPNSPKAVVSGAGFALYFSRSVIPHMRGEKENTWAEKHEYLKHIGLYAYRADVLRRISPLPQSLLELAESLEQLRWLENGFRIRVARTETESIAVDTPEDLTAAGLFLRHNRK